MDLLRVDELLHTLHNGLDVIFHVLNAVTSQLHDYARAITLSGFVEHNLHDLCLNVLLHLRLGIAPDEATDVSGLPVGGQL